MKMATLRDTSARQLLVDAGQRRDDRDVAGAALEMVNRRQRRRAVGKRDLQDAGAHAEDGQRLGFAEDADEGNAFDVGVARGGGDDQTVMVGDVDAPAVVGGAGRQRRGESVARIASASAAGSPGWALSSALDRTAAIRPMVSRASYSRSALC